MKSLLCSWFPQSKMLTQVALLEWDRKLQEFSMPSDKTRWVTLKALLFVTFSVPIALTAHLLLLLHENSEVILSTPVELIRYMIDWTEAILASYLCVMAFHYWNSIQDSILISNQMFKLDKQIKSIYILTLKFVTK